MISEDEEAFIKKLSDLISEFSDRVNTGAIIGVLELSKLRLFHQSCKQFDKKIEEEDESKSFSS